MDYNEIRSFIVAGERIDVRVDNVFHQMDYPRVFATCPQWSVWNQAARAQGAVPAFPVLLGGYDSADTAFQAAIDATQVGLLEGGK